MRSMDRRRHAKLERKKVDSGCPWAKETLEGHCVDAPVEWLDDPPGRQWVGGCFRSVGKRQREESTENLSAALSRITGHPRRVLGKPGHYEVGRYQISWTPHAINISVRLTERNIADDVLACCRLVFADKLWLVQFDEGLKRAIIACPFKAVSDETLTFMVEVLANAVEHVEALTEFFEQHPDAAEAWLIWNSGDPDRLSDWR